MGALLGAFLALSLLVTEAGLFDLIANSAAPRLTVMILVGTFAAVFAVGATLTGWIFLAIERG